MQHNIFSLFLPETHVYSIKQGPGVLSENSESNAYIRHQIDIQSPADISWKLWLKHPPCPLADLGRCAWLIPIATAPPWHLRGLANHLPIAG